MNKQLEQRLAQATDMVVILADCSASMADSAGATTKHQLLQDAVAYALGLYPGARIVAFHSVPVQVQRGRLPAPTGSTDLVRALRYIRSWLPRTTIVISDGYPNDAPAALQAARELSGQIEVVYVGPDDDQTALGFMNQLSAVGCGTLTIADLRRPVTNLPMVLRGLLPRQR